MLHGADSDIAWLQRDFGVYVANLFDTGQAARVLGFPSASLAYLLSRFCSVKARSNACPVPLPSLALHAPLGSLPCACMHAEDATSTA